MRAVLDTAYVALLLIAIAATPFFVVNWLIYVLKRKKRGPFPIKSTLFFIVPVVLGFVTSWAATSIAEGDVRQFLDSLSPNYVILIGGRPTENRDEILATLKASRSLMAHHSHPTHTIHIQISDPPRRLSLQVARDSEDPHEYWVSIASPSRLASRGDLKADIGHVQTSVFDGF
jgi:hypothetical protein